MDTEASGPNQPQLLFMWSTGDTVALSYLTLGDPMNCSTPDLRCPSLSDFAQTHVHWVTMMTIITISFSVILFLSQSFQHQDLPSKELPSHQVAKALSQLLHQSFQYHSGLILPGLHPRRVALFGSSVEQQSGLFLWRFPITTCARAIITTESEETVLEEQGFCKHFLQTVACWSLNFTTLVGSQEGSLC